MKTSSMINSVTDQPLDKTLVEYEDLKRRFELSTPQIYITDISRLSIDPEVARLVDICRAMPLNSRVHIEFYDRAKSDMLLTDPYLKTIRQDGKLASGSITIEKGTDDKKAVVRHVRHAAEIVGHFNDYTKSSTGSPFFWSGYGTYYLPDINMLRNKYMDSSSPLSFKNILANGVSYFLFNQDHMTMLDLPEGRSEHYPVYLKREGPQTNSPYADAHWYTVKQFTDVGTAYKEWYRYIHPTRSRDSGWILLVDKSPVIP